MVLQQTFQLFLEHCVAALFLEEFFASLRRFRGCTPQSQRLLEG